MFRFLSFNVNEPFELGVVHNCQHLCISTESTRGRGVRGQRTIFKMLINLWNIL